MPMVYERFPTNGSVMDLRLVVRLAPLTPWFKQMLDQPSQSLRVTPMFKKPPKV